MYTREWYQKYKVSIRKATKKWNSENRERRNIAHLKWKKENPEKVKICAAKHYRKKNPIIKHRGKGEGWKNVRLRILERDKFICQNCGKKATEVHHKDGSGSNKPSLAQNNSQENLISVCHRCNIKLDLELQGVKSFNRGRTIEDVQRNLTISELSKTVSMSEISRKFGITRQRVEQIVKKYQ